MSSPTEFSHFSPVSLPIVNAHRGAIFHAPENTLEAFDKAFDLGATSVELDVVRLSSGELVVFHGGGNHCNPGDVYDLCGLIKKDESAECEYISGSGSETSFSTTTSTQLADPEVGLDNKVIFNEIAPNQFFIEEMSLSQVKDLRFTPSASPGFADLLSAADTDFERLASEARVPLLSEVLALCKRRGAHVALEMKGTGVEHASLRMVEEVRNGESLEAASKQHI